MGSPGVADTGSYIDAGLRQEDEIQAYHWSKYVLLVSISGRASQSYTTNSRGEQEVKKDLISKDKTVKHFSS